MPAPSYSLPDRPADDPGEDILNAFIFFLDHRRSRS